MRIPGQNTIDGEVYTFDFLISSVSIETATLVSKKILPSVGKALGGLVASGMGIQGAMDTQLKELLASVKLDDIFKELAEALNPKEMSDLIKLLCSVANDKDSKPLPFEEHYKGRPGHALKVAAASFEVNCGDFFAAAVAAATNGMATIRAKTTSTGLSRG